MVLTNQLNIYHLIYDMTNIYIYIYIYTHVIDTSDHLDLDQLILYLQNAFTGKFAPMLKSGIQYINVRKHDSWLHINIPISMDHWIFGRL